VRRNQPPGDDASVQVVVNGGFSVLEMLLVLFVTAVALMIALPAFRALTGRANLMVAQQQVVAALRVQRARAVAWQRDESVQFNLAYPCIVLYAPVSGWTCAIPLGSGLRYFEGYPHLPSFCVRYDGRGTVNEGGQIGLLDERGEIGDVVLYLGDGVARTQNHMAVGGGAGRP
jgi:type II secretory pathway pseudopilin PulG